MPKARAPSRRQWRLWVAAGVIVTAAAVMGAHALHEAPAEDPHLAYHRALQRALDCHREAARPCLDAERAAIEARHRVRWPESSGRER